MKTPSFLLLGAALSCAPAAFAGSASTPVPPDRCDKAWLENASKIEHSTTEFSGRRDFITAAVAMSYVKFGHPELCSGAVWRQLSPRAEEDGKALLPKLDDWTPGGKAAWSGGVASGAKLLQVVGDFYEKFDAQASKALAAADSALEASVKLGLMEAKGGEKTMGELLPGGTGGRFSISKPRAFEPKSGGSANLPREEFGAAIRLLTDGAGGPGEKILEFRREVIALTILLAEQARSVDAVKARFSAPPAELRDLVAPLPEGFKPAEPKDAADAAAFGGALAALAGVSVSPKLDDAAPHDRAALDRVDLAVRNLLLVRAAELDKAVELAAARLGGKSIEQHDLEARMREEAAKRTSDRNTLAAATIEALAGNKDYQDLDRLYQDALRRAGGDESKLKPEEKAAGEALQRIQAAAATAVTKTGEKAEISYTLDGKPESRRITMPSVVAGDVEADEATRRDVAAEIARDVVAGNLADAKVAAALAALRGQEPRADDAPEGVKPPAAADAPPKPETAWDAAANSADAGCGVNPANLARGKAERVALRQAERAAEDATEMSEARRRLQDELRAELKKINDACDREIAGIRAKQRSPRLTAEAKAAQIQEEVNRAEERCNAALQAEEEKFAPRIEAVKRETQDANARQALVRAEGERAKWYSEGIPQALDELLEDYTKGDRRAALVARTFDDETVNDDVAKFFRDLPASFRTDCAKALGYDADPGNGRFSDPAKLRDPVAGEVETRCSASVTVHKDKVAGVKAACKAEYATAADGADKRVLTAPLKDALCAAVAAKMGSLGTSGEAPAPVGRRRPTIPGGE